MGAGGCAVTTSKGGIIRAIFKACNYTALTTLTTLADWTTAITADKVHATGRIVGQRPKPTFTKRKVDSAAPEKIIGGTQSVTYRDYNTSSAAHDFYDDLNANSEKYHFAYYDANGYVFGFFENISVEAGFVAEEDSESGSAYWDVTVMWNGYEQPAGVSVPTLETVLA
jgi:hypothetical protein